jgi:hypothetical protein
MKSTAYDSLVRILGLWFVNYTSHLISERFDPKPHSRQPSSPEFTSVSPPNGLTSSGRLKSFEMEINDIPELNLPAQAMGSINTTNDASQRSKPKVSCKCFKTFMYYFLNICYICFILTMICWKPIYKINNASKYPHWMANAFMYIIPLQYLTELIYFRTSHFYKTLSMQKDFAYVANFYSKFALIASSIASIVSVLLFTFTDNLDIYVTLKQHAPTNKLIFLGTVCAFEHFYSYCIFFCSIFTFAIVFIIHGMAINKFSTFVNAMKYDVASVNYIFNTYINLKKEYEKSVDHLNTMFATTTILGLLSTYGAFSHMPMHAFVQDIFDVLYIILYIIAEMIYFYSIYRVRKAITLIKTTILSGVFARKYLSRQPFQEPTMSLHPSIGNFKNLVHIDQGTIDASISDIVSNMNKINKHIACMSSNMRDTMTSGDWIILTKLVTVKWKNFTLLGFEVEDTQFVKRIGAIVMTYILTSKFQDKFDLHGNY